MLGVYPSFEHPASLTGSTLYGILNKMILIKNSLVVDGTGKPPAQADILIKDDRISVIGNVPAQAAPLVINGQGLIAAPGFIDINTDSDHYLSLFTDPAQQDFLLQGVTTIIGGHCGSSLAPLIKGTLESIRKWADINQISVNWNTVAEFFKTLEQLKIGVNFGMLAGHSTIRRALIGDAHRDLTVGELNIVKHSIQAALRDGVLGVSTGLGYSHGKAASFMELKQVIELVAKAGGIYSTHLRSERADVVNAVSETLEIARVTGVKTLISHFRPIIGFTEEYEQARALLERASGIDIHFDLYPFDYSIIPIYTLLPEWAQEGSLEQMVERLKEPQFAAEIIKSLRIAAANELVIARAPGMDYLVGKSIAAFSDNRAEKIEKSILYLMQATKLRALLFHNNIDLALTQAALLSPKVFVASNSPSLLETRNVLENERAKKTFSTFLALAGAQGKKLEWAIEKITNAPATFLKLKDRGTLREGAYADVVLFHPKESGARYVFINGKPAVIDGRLESTRSGVILRRV